MAFAFDHEEGEVYSFALTFPYSYSRCAALVKRLSRRKGPELPEEEEEEDGEDLDIPKEPRRRSREIIRVETLAKSVVSAHSFEYFLLSAFPKFACAREEPFGLVQKLSQHYLTIIFCLHAAWAASPIGHHHGRCGGGRQWEKLGHRFDQVSPLRFSNVFHCSR